MSNKIRVIKGIHDELIVLGSSPQQVEVALNAYSAERIAARVACRSQEHVRTAFQIRYPHYTPAVWMLDPLFWVAWADANVKLHGSDGFAERFPKHAAIWARRPLFESDEALGGALWDATYDGEAT